MSDMLQLVVTPPALTTDYLVVSAFLGDGHLSQRRDADHAEFRREKFMT